MSSIKEVYHPNAYLKQVKNVKTGLNVRTKILRQLDNQPYTASKIAKNASLSYNVIMYHLRLLEKDATVSRRGGRPRIWVITGLGQKRLI
ncbi:MAG: winged helix-turn-helix transcriptional regulator [Crenarchaeota archaeon]|nr:winged helix-turn-helix transcriptional regulator [Thermoproteota archaeon]